MDAKALIARSCRGVLALVALVCLTACHLQWGSSRVQTQAASANLSIRSQFTQASYPVHIYLPPSYHTQTSSKFPVLYVTDGQWFFAMVKQMLEQRHLEVIVVAVEQGSLNRRYLDYALPGARAYRQFLLQELIPQIESQYRINDQRRTLAGASLGGVLIGLNMLWDAEEGQHFRNYWAFDGSFFELDKPAYRDLTAIPKHSLQGQVYLTGASQGNALGVQGFAQRISRDFPQLKLTHTSLAGDHQGAIIPSFEAAIAAYDPER